MKQENIDKLSRVLDKPALRVEQISEEDIKALQRILKSEGLYQGRIDGDFGGGTSRGLLKAFEQNPSLINSLSPAYLKLMQDNGLGKQLQQLVANNSRITADLVEDAKRLLDDPKYAKHHSFQQSNLYLLGFYDDEIDGIKGKNHKDAIREFKEKYPSAGSPAPAPAPARNQTPFPTPARDNNPEPPKQPVGETRLAGTPAETTVEAAPAGDPAPTRQMPPARVRQDVPQITPASYSAAATTVPVLSGTGEPVTTGSGHELSTAILRQTHEFIQSRAIDPQYPPLFPTQVDTDIGGQETQEKDGPSLWQRFKNLFNGKAEGGPEQSVIPQTASREDLRRLWGVMEQARTAGISAPKTETGYEPYEPILALIRQKESGDNYDIGHNHVNRGYSRMTINEVLKDQEDWCNRRREAGRGIYSYFEGRASSVAGAYQIKHSTLESLVKELGLTGNERFDKAMQDRLASALLNRRDYDDYLAGEITTKRMVRNLSGEWASFPKDPSNDSRYGNDGLNRALIGYKPTHDILQYVRSEFQTQAGDPSAGMQFATNVPGPETGQPATPAATEDTGPKPRKDHHSVLTTDVRFT